MQRPRESWQAVVARAWQPGDEARTEALADPHELMRLYFGGGDIGAAAVLRPHDPAPAAAGSQSRFPCICANR